MATQRRLIGIVDRPGPDRDALAETIARGEFAVVAAEHVDDLPRETVMVVAHARAVPAQEWPSLAARLPTMVVSESRLDSDLLKAVDAGMVDYVVEPLRHGDILRRMIGKVIDNRRLADEHERDRVNLAELNETLETHLAMLRLDQQAGGHIQRKLLPLRPQSIAGVTYDYWLAPSLYLSGDFLDFHRYDERFSVFYFADVSGHGASSAFVTVLLKYLCNHWLGEWDGRQPEHLPSSWLGKLNRELLDTGIGKHATLFVGVVDHRERYLHYSLGAQMPMPMLVVNENIQVLPGEGMPVGLFPSVEYPNLGMELPSDFRLWLCSDGILECLSGDTLDRRLKELERLVLASKDLEALRGSLALGDVPDNDEDAVIQRAPGYEELPDDLTIMTLNGFGDDNA
ncbi:PP2C family protein-serine/threonine phosphatase [Aidingimonas halophila]|uniref:Serine phosphatase RsbU, regulator of sigma subunit n=1 Tax=Aidingimonas halophila TaxID=574349 RepID=A0A1H3ETS8_9GAMM|nr:SpoIIE family protein phosphatase [Aidingimonas halophila]GHC31704.1 fused response regulator/phosphatase [Aidingimonas halophila]SDX81987.1 Serine phosphatase RsbU, regulator of sigma subunit [Aidingimonas halophila]